MTPRTLPSRLRRAAALALLTDLGLSLYEARKVLSELQCRPGATWRTRPGARAYFDRAALMAAVSA